jgi:hypothetical protein
VERALAQAFDVSKASISTFRRRLRHLKTQGIPEAKSGDAAGSALYTPWDIVQFVLALEFEASGIEPSSTLQLMKKLSNEELVRHLFDLVAGEEEHWLLVYAPDVVDGKIKDVRLLQTHVLVPRLGQMLAEHGRVMVIDVTARIRRVYQHLF